MWRFTVDHARLLFVDHQLLLRPHLTLHREHDLSQLRRRTTVRQPKRRAHKILHICYFCLILTKIGTR